MEDELIKIKRKLIEKIQKINRKNSKNSLTYNHKDDTIYTVMIDCM